MKQLQTPKNQTKFHVKTPCIHFKCLPHHNVMVITGGLYICLAFSNPSKTTFEIKQSGSSHIFCGAAPGHVQHKPHAPHKFISSSENIHIRNVLVTYAQHVGQSQDGTLRQVPYRRLQKVHFGVSATCWAPGPVLPVLKTSGAVWCTHYKLTSALLFLFIQGTCAPAEMLWFGLSRNSHNETDPSGSAATSFFAKLKFDMLIARSV